MDPHHGQPTPAQPHMRKTTTRAAFGNDKWPNGSVSDLWMDIVIAALERLGGAASLAELYQEIESHPRARTRPNWKAKVRQKIQISNVFSRLGPGRWTFSRLLPDVEVAKLAALRRERYPERTRPTS